MAQAMICDRCSDFFKLEARRHGEFVSDYVTVGVRVNINGQTYDKKFLDLCPRCREELDAWINEKKLPGDYMDEMKEDEQ